MNIPDKEKLSSKPSMVFLFHKDWNLVINMMIGTYKSIRAVWDSDDHILAKSDYKIKDVFQLNYDRSIDDKEVLKGTCHFSSYCPYVFADIRKIYGIDDEKFLASIGSESLISSLMKGELRAFTELTSSGKSGSFFFYSVDGKYVLKTIRKEEYSFLRKILKEYHEHLKTHKTTLVPKFFSLNKIHFDNFRLKRELGYDHVYFVVMNNIFSKNIFIHERYDLKGSTYKREVFPAQSYLRRDELDFKTNRIAMKDLDFIRMKSFLDVTGAQRTRLLDILQKDCNFFEKLGIIDYSLLVGVHYKDRMGTENKVSTDDGEFGFEDSSEEMHEGRVVSEASTCLNFDSPNGNETYLIGIIDTLTSFGSIKKKLEYAIKRVCIGDSISCIPPKQYATRFATFIDRITQKPKVPRFLDANNTENLQNHPIKAHTVK